MAEEIKVTIEKDDSKNLTKLDPDQSLPKLRRTLTDKGFMGEDDLFQSKGAKITKKEEFEFTGRDVIEKDTLTLTCKSSKSSPVKPGETLDLSQNIDTKEGFKEGFKLEENSNQDPTEGKMGEDSDTATTEYEDRYSDLDSDKRKNLFDVLQLSKALRLTSSGFEKCFPSTFTWDQDDPTHVVPEKTLRVDKSFSFSKTIHELRKRGVKNVKASGGGFGVAASGEYSHEKESLSRSEKTTVYLLATYDVPKVRLKIPIEKIKVSEEFGKAVSEAIDDTDSANCYYRLLKVLNEYGFYVPTEFTLGGQIYAEDRKTVESTVEAESETDSFAVALEANLVIGGVPAQGGGGYGQSDSRQETNAESKAARSITKQIRGGDPAKANNSAEWIASLGPYLRWSIMEYVELTPTIMFLESSLQSKCIGLISQHCQNVQINKETFLDMESYAKPLDELLVEDF